MIYNVKNNEFNLIGSSCYQGAIICRYETLCKCFGDPLEPTGHDKIDAHWIIQFEDNSVASIYNYKDGKAYNGKKGTPTKKITFWHVGGQFKEVVDKVKEIVSPEESHLPPLQKIEPFIARALNVRYVDHD